MGGVRSQMPTRRGRSEQKVVQRGLAGAGTAKPGRQAIPCSCAPVLDIASDTYRPKIDRGAEVGTKWTEDDEQVSIEQKPEQCKGNRKVH